MKRYIVIIVALLLAAITFLSFKMKTKEVKPTEKYETMWKQFDEHLKNSLPESAEKVLNEIEGKALKDHNDIQLLKTILYRRKVMDQTIEEAPEQAYLAYAEGKLETLDEVSQAVLHCQIAEIYSDYLEENGYIIMENLAIDGDMSSKEMKYWDKQTFLDLIDQHYAEALKPVKLLQEADTKDYLCLFEKNHNDYVEYEPTMFDFLFHRVAKHYRESQTADDIDPAWNTDLWWLDDKDFVKADLGDSDKPVIKCLKIFQQLIGFNMKDNQECALYNDYKRFEFVNDILDDIEKYQKAMRSLMEANKGNDFYPHYVYAYASSLVEQYESNPNDSSLFDNYRKALELCQKTVADYPKNTYYCKRTIEHITAPNVNVTFNQVQLPGEDIPVALEYRNVEHPELLVYSITENELKDYSRLYKDGILKALDKKTPVRRQVPDLPAETDYRTHSTLGTMPALDAGLYYFVAKTESNAKPSYTTMLAFQVSSLSFVTNSSHVGVLDIVVLDRKTGQPVQDATVEIISERYNYEKKKYEIIVHKTLKTDKNGLAQNSSGIATFQITLKKGNDVLLSNNSFNLPSSSGNSYAHDRTTLLTDRAIYRPGQTVYFKGIMTHHDGDRKSLITNGTETIRFRDANWQEISSAKFTTDEYGGFSGSFVIPTNLLNGSFTLQGIHGSTNNESSVPGRGSEGCIRLRNDDLDDLKENYAFEGMRVVILPDE